jgi:hypothetical protein
MSNRAVNGDGGIDRITVAAPTIAWPYGLTAAAM